MCDRHISYIDGLRGIAVFAVVAFHLWPEVFTGAFSGVDVFFVISGFVVSASLARRKEESFSNFIAGFYARRFARILPGLLLVVWVGSMFSVFLTPRVWVSQLTERTARYSLLGLSNWILAQGESYFDPAKEFNPFLHTWSLGIEEQFYLIFPIIFFFISAVAMTRIFRKIGIAVLVVLSFLSFALAAAKPWGTTVSYYSLFERFWELGAGALVYLVVSSKWFGDSIAAGKFFFGTITVRVFVWTAATAVIVGLGFSEQNHFPYPWAILHVLGTCGLLMGLHAEVLLVRRPSLIHLLLSSCPLVYMGRLSYSIYLWHWLVIVMFHWTVGIQSTANIFFALMLSFVLALASYYVVERPIRRLATGPKWRPVWVIAVSLAFIGTSVWSLKRFYWKQPDLSLAKAASRVDWWTGFDGSLGTACLGRIRFQDFEDGVIVEVRAGECQRLKEQRRLFVLGDSHAAVYGPMLAKVAAEIGMDVSLYTFAGCEVFNMAHPLSPITPMCEKFYRRAREVIASRAKAGDILFVVGLKVPRLSDQADLRYNPSIYQRQSTDEQKALQKMEFEQSGFDALLAKKIRIVLEAPKPIFRSSPFRCADWFNSMNPVCEPGFEINRDFLLADRKFAMDTFRKFKSASNLISIWDPFPVLCPDEICRAFRGERPLYMDGDHISRFGNFVLYDSFVHHILGPHPNAH